MSKLLTKSYSIQGVSGGILRVEETVERYEVVVSISEGKDVCCVRLNKDQFDAIGRLFETYSSDKLECNYKKEDLSETDE